MTLLRARRVLPMPVVAVLAFGAYFSLMLLAQLRPSFGSTQWFFAYVLSVAVILIGIVGLLVFGSTLFIYALVRRRNDQLGRNLLIVGTAGLLCFVAVQLTANYVRGSLPTGSKAARFSAVVWKNPDSSNYVDGDITPRQKMLGDIVENILPGKTRAQIEALLGPSLDSNYFRKAKWDLIYVTGPQRDSFFAIDSEWLLIWLDERGRFERYEIYTD